MAAGLYSMRSAILRIETSDTRGYEEVARRVEYGSADRFAVAFLTFLDSQ